MLSLRMLLVATLATPALTAQEGERLADHLPANTLFYFEIPEISALRDGLQTAALGRVWQDDATQAFLGSMVAEGMAQFESAREGMQEAGIPMFMSWDSMKSFEFGVATQATDNPESPAMFVATQINFAEGVAEPAFEMLKGVLQSEMQVDVSEGENGATMRMSLGPDAPMVTITRTGTRIQASMAMNMQVGTSLASNETFRRSRAQILQPGMACFGYYNPKAAIEMQKAYLNFGTAEGEFASMADTVSQFAESAMGNAHAMCFGSGWSNGQSIGRSFIDFNGKPAGWAYGSTAADRDLLDYVPADATSFSVAGLADESSFNEVFAGIDSIIQDPALKENIAVWAQAEPISHSWMVGENRPLLEAAMAGIGSRMFSYSSPAASRSFLELTDPAAVQAALTPAMKTVAQLLDSVDGLPVALRARRESPRSNPSVSVPIYYLRIKTEELPPQFQQVSLFLGGVEPAFAVSPDGWLVMSMSRPQVRGMIRSGLTANDQNIRSNTDVAAFLSRAPMDSRQIAWSDPRPAVAQTMNMVQMLSGFAGSQIDPSQLPVDLTKIPTAASINAHLRPSESYTWMEDGALMSHSSGSLGFADMLALAGYAVPAAGMMWMYMPQAASGPMLEMQAPPPPPEIHGDGSGHHHDPMVKTQEDLARLQTGILVYEIIHEKSPASLAVLLEAGPEGEAYLDAPQRGVPTDGWNNMFIYRLEGDSFILYSTGPDGVDQGGKGDDVSVGG